MLDEKKLPSLTPNGRKLVEKLASLPRTWLTTAALAQALEISRRTVMRELPGVEEWLSAAGFRLLRSPGQGILLDEGLDSRKALRALLEEGQEKPTLPRKQRRQQLLIELFAADGPVKTYALAHELDISEHALAGDLDVLEGWLKPYEVTLCRRPGVGIWLEGTPEKRRRAAGALLRLHLPDQDWQAFLQGEPLPDAPLTALLDPAVSKKVWDVLQAFEQEQQLSFTDAGFLSLAVHITLTIQQLQKGTADSVALACPADSALAGQLARRLEKAFGLSFSRTEVGYLSLYLDAYRGQLPSDGPDSRELNLRYLASVLISGIEREMGVSLSQYPSLGDDLCCHLRPMMHRLEQGTHAENPQLELIQEQYPKLWQATRAACDQAQQQLSLPAIPDAEAGFLAMHFGAVLEQDALARMRLNVVVVCPYGMASSRFLTSQLMRDFPVFHIQSSSSVRALEPDTLRANGVDLIISTVPLQLDYPHVCVNPILQEQDKAVLRAAIQRAQAAPPPAAQVQSTPAENRAEALRYAAQLSASILELLDTMTVCPVAVPGSRQTLIREASRLFCPLAADAQAVEQALLHREELGDTYIQPLQALLLHCRTSAVSGCRFGYLQAQPPVYEPGRSICGALVLLAPDREDGIPVKVIQAVSALLIEQPALMEQLRAGDRRQAAATLEKGLGDRFRQALTIRIRGKK